MNVNIDRKVTSPERNSLVPKYQMDKDFSDGLYKPRSTTDICSVSKCLEISHGKKMVPTGESSVETCVRSPWKQENCGQGDSKNNDDKSSKLRVTSSCDYSTSAILVPVISNTSGRNLLEEMKRKAAQNLLNRQQMTLSMNGSKSSLVPGTDVEYRTPGANHKNKNGRIKRPMNAFMVWARDFRGRLATSMPNATNSEISVKLGQIWAAMRADDKKKYYDIAEKIKAKHRKDYPDWVYQPSSPGMKKREEVFNYGRTPTPPPSNEYANRVPVSSTSSTQQTTIVVLSNDNKIQHTRLTSSESLTLLKPGTTSHLVNTSVSTGSQEKVVPGKLIKNNKPQNPFENPHTISTKDIRGIKEPLLHSHKNHSDKEKSTLRPSVDPSHVQYQSAMEIYEKNKVSDKTKDLLASKIMSIRPVVADCYKSKQVSGKGKEECTKSACTTEQQQKTETQNITNMNTCCTKVNSSSYSRNEYPITTNYLSNAESMPKSEQTILTSKLTPTPKSHVNTNAQFTNVFLTNSRSVINPGIKHSLDECQNMITPAALPMSNKHNTHVENHHFKNVRPKINEPGMLKSLNQAPLLLGMNFRTPNVRPALASGMIHVANGNRARCELQRMIPKGSNIAQHLSVPMAESFISPTATSHRHNVIQRDSPRLENKASNTILSSISATSTDNVSIDKQEVKDVQEEKNTPPTLDESIAEGKAPEVDLKATEDILESFVPNISDYFPPDNDPDEIFGSSFKQADELWPFPFSDNPGDWNDDERDKYLYVELIDPYDPFLNPKDMMSEMYPGSLTLDMDRWKNYLTTKPEVGSEYLEDCFHETAEDITISPVPLRETLRRLKNTKTEVSDMCDVISGDMITEGFDENLDLVPEDRAEILTDDLARKLSGIMGSFVAEVNDKINETDNDIHEQITDDMKTNQINTDPLLEKTSMDVSESTETGRNNEAANCQRDGYQTHSDEKTGGGAVKSTPDDGNNKDKNCLSKITSKDENAVKSQRDENQNKTYKKADYKQISTAVENSLGGNCAPKITSLTSLKNVFLSGQSVTDCSKEPIKTKNGEANDLYTMNVREQNRNAVLRRRTRSMSRKKAK